MRHRPLFTAALLLAAGIFFLHSVCGIDFFPKKWEPFFTLSLQGSVVKVEEKEVLAYLFLKDVTVQRKQNADEPLQTEHYKSVLLTGDKAAYFADALEAGNVISADVVYEGFSSARNAGNFDEAEYYHSLGVCEKFRLKDNFAIVDARKDPLRAFLQRVRKKLSDVLLQAAGKDSTSGVFLALLTGDRSALAPETKDLYRKSGIAHVLAISGLHISFLGMMLFSLLRKRLRFSVSALVSACTMICFCIMSGESASAIRATVLFLVRLPAIYLGKRFDMLSALGLAALLLLLQNPMFLYNTGFLLSFGAVLGLALFLPPLRRLLCAEAGGQAAGAIEGIPFTAVLRGQVGCFAYAAYVLSRLKQPFLSSLSVTLFTLPILVNTYYEFPLFSVLLNMAVIPLMGAVLESAVAGAVCGLFSILCGRFFLGTGVYLLTFTEWLCVLFDKLPFAMPVTGYMQNYKIILYYLLLGIFLWAAPRMLRILEKKKIGKEKFMRPLCLAVLLLLLCGLVGIRTPEKNLQLTFFDVDQGDGILLKAPDGTVILIDGGSSSVSELYSYRLESALKYKKIKAIDYAIVTHTDIDHISALEEMMEQKGAGRIPVKTILVPEITGHATYEAFLQKACETDTSVQTLREGITLTCGALSLTCLHPSKDYRSENVNGYSAVMQLTYGSFTALFTGDLEQDGEARLLQQGAVGKQQLLKVAHHGAKNAHSQAFLERIRPDIAVISCGVDNRYGHPHKETVQHLEAAGAQLFITAQTGQIDMQVTIDGRITAKTMFEMPS